MFDKIMKVKIKYTNQSQQKQLKKNNQKKEAIRQVERITKNQIYEQK